MALFVFQVLLAMLFIACLRCAGAFVFQILLAMLFIACLRRAGARPCVLLAARQVYLESFEKAKVCFGVATQHGPSLNEVGVKQWLHGPDTHSADHARIIGRLPGTDDNCLLATGLNSLGIQCGP